MSDILPKVEEISRLDTIKHHELIKQATAELEVSVARQLLNLEHVVSMIVTDEGAETREEYQLVDKYDSDVLSAAAKMVVSKLSISGYRVGRVYTEDGRCYVEVDWK